MNIYKIKSLLSGIREIKKKSEELCKLKGENFNIFKLLNLGWSENFHSKFIAELLDPNGSHGHGDLFLKAFIKQLNEEIGQDLPSTFLVVGDGVKTEKYISPINFDSADGGRLDILIQTDKFVIGIENKIYAGDGYLQLERYKKFMTTFLNSRTLLLYLTLDGRLPKSSELRINEDYHCISYENLIGKWIMDCQAIANDSPILRETIKQYLINLKSLSKLLTTQQMEKDLILLLNEYYDEAHLVASHIGKLQNRKLIELYGLIKEKVKQKLPAGWIMNMSLEILENEWHQFSFRQDWIEGLSVSFEGTSRFVDGIGHGILFSSDKHDKNQIKRDLAKKFKMSKRTNSWMTYSSGRYTKLATHLNGSIELDQLAEEISDYMIQVLEREKLSCQIINQHLNSKGMTNGK
ncbi:hypothetical protein P872_06040 [Rhodonellum psychrophilum GCM71 = DSM 17998]|uniref:Uncharacterized protein n=2 Tax=Rhodonellum TaxID=336827 RepID=U5C281_9BACT|nr:MULTISPECIES: PD-(D/E)XK nuclease family protein [Rhodonellum]ERM83031.1 hypothetical protein P872_06040 [Rhodonellum psychrophilum GCM71 = DSM 17998]SDZ47608.1 PD-(D/E)XK nuclease superfamily protein [Rhodonellum ikkaensis]